VVNLSIVEFGVYGFVAYSSLLMLLISAIKNVEETKISALTRSIIFLPGIICAGILITAGVDINLDTVSTFTITNNTVSTIFYEDTVTTDKITLLDPVWGSVHFIIFIVLIIYVIKQILLMLGIGKNTPNNSN
jgi:hypothetical protein